MYKFFHAVDSTFIRGARLLLLFIFIAEAVFSQSTIVKGKVTDKDTGLPIPFVSILFKNTRIGTTSDSLGVFQLVSKNKVDSIRFTAVGYIGKTYAVLPLKTMDLPVALQSDMVNISEVKVRPDDGPVRRILKKMVDHKKTKQPGQISPRFVPKIHQMGISPHECGQQNDSVEGFSERSVGF